jgi:hypothetical protein
VYIIKVGAAEDESSHNVIHEALKRLGGVALTEDREEEFEEAKGSGDDCFLYVVGMDRNVDACLHQIDLREEAKTRELVGIIVYVTDGIVAGNDSGNQRSIVSARAQTVVLFGQDM